MLTCDQSSVESHVVCVCIRTPARVTRRYLLGDQLGHHVAGVDVDGTDGHDLLPVARRQLPQQHVDQGVQLGDLWGGEGTKEPLTRPFRFNIDV